MSVMLLAPDPAYLLAALGAVAVLIAVLVIADFGHSCRKFKRDASVPRKNLTIRWVRTEQSDSVSIEEEPLVSAVTEEAEQETAVSLVPPAALAVKAPAELAVMPPAALAVKAPAELAVMQERRDFAAEHRVSVAEAAEMMADEEAEAQMERSGRIADKTRTAIVNIDTLSDYFEDGEYVDIDAMKARIPFFDKRATYVKVLARGILTKTLEVEADVYSMEAAKMILLLGGKVIVTIKE